MSPRVAQVGTKRHGLHDSASGFWGPRGVRRCLCRRSCAVDHRSLIRYPYVDVDVDVDSRSDDDDDSALSSNDDDSALSPDHDDSTEATLDHHHVAGASIVPRPQRPIRRSARSATTTTQVFNHHAANDDVDASGAPTSQPTTTSTRPGATHDACRPTTVAAEEWAVVDSVDRCCAVAMGKSARRST